MNYYFIAAGIFLFFTFLIHVIAGNKEFYLLNPRKQSIESEKLHGIWLMGLCGFQMVSIDLLLTAVFIFLMGIDVIPFNLYLSIFIAALYAGYLIFWLVTLSLFKSGRKNFLCQGQWILFLIALILIVSGLNKVTNL